MEKFQDYFTEFLQFTLYCIIPVWIKETEEKIKELGDEGKL